MGALAGLMFDTAQSSYESVPAEAEAIAPYMDRRYNNIAAAERRFPHLVAQKRVLSITAASGDADCVDWEPGNQDPDPPSWYAQQHNKGRWRPCFYADQSDMRSVIPRLEAKLGKLPAPGPKRPVRIFTAHPTGKRHLCGPSTCGFPWDADASQWWWTSKQGRWPGANGDVDVSLFLPSFFQSVPAKPAGPVLPSGIANASIEFDVHTKRWNVTGTPSAPIKWERAPGREASALLKLNTSNGHWSVSPLPWGFDPSK